MITYRIAGFEFRFSHPVNELEPYRCSNSRPAAAPEPPVPIIQERYCTATGWIAGEWRKVECWSAPPGLLLRVAGGSDFYINTGGQEITPVLQEGSQLRILNKELTRLDVEILLGPALVLALALRGTWCLHASAAVYHDRAIAFLGESGFGKSTLAASLATDGTPAWGLLADDILPVTLGTEAVTTWPHFPQLKLPIDSQPGRNWPEQIPLREICILTRAASESEPELHRLSPGDAAQVLLSHTAGTRMFTKELLAKHLDECAEAVRQLSVYRLAYPHRKSALPRMKELLENLW
jgi:hypothetical protein